ncbi:MAG TPA: hypothetical protein VMV86_00310 [Methanosarcinales archaeon]|nr:hypothetical protein [Methanosarcinales archaeon]
MDIRDTLKEKQFYGTLDRLNRNEITEAEAEAELNGDMSHVDLTPLTPPDAYEYAQELINAGVERQESWSRWIQKTALNPGMDAKDWFKIYDIVSAY